MKKILLSGLVLIVVAMIGLPLWATSVLTGDTVRSAIAAQVAKAIGQPVTIGAISASVFPRVTLNLTNVRIGEPARVVAASLHLGTDLRALLSRRIEHATVRLSGARVELPLPTFTLGDSSPSDSKTTSAPVEIVSIDEIVLRDVQIVSGGRTVTGDVEVVPQGNAIQIRRIALGAGETTIQRHLGARRRGQPQSDLARLRSPARLRVRLLGRRFDSRGHQRGAGGARRRARAPGERDVRFEPGRLARGRPRIDG
jgi:autotransporter translocation and assembly factor TamB